MAGSEQVKFSPDGTRVATTSADGRLTVWNTTGKSRRQGGGYGTSSSFNTFEFRGDELPLLRNRYFFSPLRKSKVPEPASTKLGRLQA